MGIKGVENYPGKKPPRNRAVHKPKRIDDPFSGIKPATYILRGERVEVFTVGQLAKVIARKAVTVRAWETKGIIPPPTYRTQLPTGKQIPGKSLKGRRLYTRKQVDLILFAVDTYLGDTHPRLVPVAAWNKLKQYIQDNWKN